MSGLNLTTFQGRQCTRVKREAVVATPGSANTTLLSSISTPTASAAASVQTNGAVSPAAASSRLSTPTPGLPPSPSDSETNTLAPQSVNRSMGTSTGETTTSTAATATKTTPLTATQETVRDPSISLKPAVAPSSTSKFTSPKPAVLASSTAAAAPNIIPVAAPSLSVLSSNVLSSPLAPAQPTPGQPTQGQITQGQITQGQATQGQATQGQATQGQANQPSAIPNQSFNSPAAVSTAPAGGGQLPAFTGPQSSAQGTSPVGPIAVSAASEAGSPPSQSTGAANPGESPIQAQPIPILASSVPGGSIPSAAGTITASIVSAQLTAGKPTTATSVIVSTNRAGKPTSFTSTIVYTPTVAVISGGATSGAGSGGGAGAGTSSSQQDGKRVDAGTVMGAVAGAISFTVLAALIFLCGRRWRKKRNRGSGAPLLNRSSGGQSKTSLSEKLSGLLGKRGSPAGDPNVRVSTPALERGMRETSSNRNRSSSVPVTAFRDRAMGILKGKARRSRSPAGVGVTRGPQDNANQPPQVRTPTPIAQHRRSASSVSSIIQSWSATDENNNPFRDPDPHQRLQIVNPDLSRSNTARTIPQLPPVLIPKPLSPSIKSPSMMAKGSAAGITAAAAAAIPTMAIPPKPRHKRSFSQRRISNPFMDPEPSTASPKSPVQPQYTLPEDLTAPEPLEFKRNNTFPMGRPLQHQLSKSSVDSGFVSAKSPFEDQKEDAPGFRGNSDPLRQWHLSTVLSSEGSRRSSDTGESPFADSNRISKSSYLSGQENLSSSPGPTRPVTSAYPSYLLDRNSSASDPFDLDRPEILGLMKPHWTIASRDTSLSRSGSHRSDKSGYSRATTATPIPPLTAKRKSGTPSATN